MSENRFWFVIDKGKLEYVQDNVTGEKITVSELEDLLNELSEDKEYFERKKEYFLSKWSIAHTENIQLRQEVAELKTRNAVLSSELNQIPESIKREWLE